MKFEADNSGIILTPESEEDKVKIENLLTNMNKFMCSKLEDGSLKLEIVQRYLPKRDWNLDD